MIRVARLWDRVVGQGVALADRTGVLMPATPFAYPQVASRRFVSSNS